MHQKSKVNRIVLVILVLVVSSFFHFGATEKRFDCPVVVFKKSVLKTKIQMKHYLLSTLIVSGAVLTATAQTPSFKNPSLTAKERAIDLCSRLTLEEKAQLMLDESPAIPRLGIKKFFWWSEALHGAANMGNVTNFPEPVAMASSFNPALLYKVFDVASTEFRAQYNQEDKRLMARIHI